MKLIRSPFLFSVLLSSSLAHATDYTWTGNNTPFTTTSNWTPTGAPSSSADNIVGESLSTSQANLAGSVTVGNIAVNNIWSVVSNGPTSSLTASNLNVGANFNVRRTNGVGAYAMSFTANQVNVSGGAVATLGATQASGPDDGLVSLTVNSGVSFGTGGGTFHINVLGANYSLGEISSTAGASTANLVLGYSSDGTAGYTFTVNATDLSSATGNALVIAASAQTNPENVTLNLTGPGSYSSTAVLKDTIGATGSLTPIGTLSLVKSGSGTQVLTGNNTYSGATTVNGGVLSFTGNNVGSVTALTVNSGGTLNEDHSGGTTGSILSSTDALTLAGGAFTDTGAVSGTSTQTLGSIALTGGASSLTLTGSASATNTLTITNGVLPRSNGGTVDFVSPTGTALKLSGNANIAFLGTFAFFGTGTSETYAATKAAGLVGAATLTSATSGINSLTSATTDYNYVSPAVTDTLTASRTADSVVFSTTGAQAVSLGSSGAFNLTLNGLLNTNGALTISSSGTSTGAVVIGSNKELIIAGGSNVTIAAPVVDSSAGASALTSSDSATLTLSNATGNSYSGGTTVNSGTLVVSNTSGSATGSGALAVAAGATLAGQGTSSGSSFKIGGASGSKATVLVGQNTNSATNTTGNLGLSATTGTITNANLVFNLNAQLASGTPVSTTGIGTANSGNELVVGGTAINFGSGVSLTLNLQNEPAVIAGYTPYILFAGNVGAGNATQYSGLTLGAVTTNGSVTTTAISSLSLNFGSTVDSSFYGANSYVFLYQDSATGVDNIEVAVVPEPSTYAMILGGLAVLIFRLRRKNRS